MAQKDYGFDLLWQDVNRAMKAMHDRIGELACDIQRLNGHETIIPMKRTKGVMFLSTTRAFGEDTKVEITVVLEDGNPTTLSGCTLTMLSDITIELRAIAKAHTI